MTGPTSRWRPLRTFAAIGLALLILVSGRFILAAEPSLVAQIGPFVHTGVAGEDVDGRTFTVRVVSVRGSTLLEERPPLTTSGVFVLVLVRVTASMEPVFLATITSYDRSGASFEPTNRIQQPSVPSRFEPGVPVEFDVVFELPPDAATSLTLRFSEAGVITEFAEFVDVRLDVSSAQVEEWSRSRRPIEPYAREVVL